MANLKDWAIIFDVDGVLLELTRPEEEIFFEALGRYVPAHELSRDWNSYRIRNEDDIIAEVLARYHLPADLKREAINAYVTLLEEKLRGSVVASHAIAGAAWLISEVQSFARVGIATANFREGARLRLQAVGLWDAVADHAFGADGGGHKSEILARAIAVIGLPISRVVFVGDNRNDVIAGHENGCHFIGFSTSAERRRELTEAGAQHLAANHQETLGFIRRFSGN